MARICRPHTRLATPEQAHLRHPLFRAIMPLGTQRRAVPDRRGQAVVTVQTIRGPVDSSALGRTLSHEHLTNGVSGMERIPGLLDRDEMVDRCVGALERVRRSGIDTVIDLTPFDLGRQIWLFERVAERTQVNVVCAT